MVYDYIDLITQMITLAKGTFSKNA
jgi:hypothetical protein